ncbi:MAG: M23 family metallopeptidase [Chitinophagaceae bacterium]
MKYVPVLFLMAISLNGFAQKNKASAKKDTLRISCPLTGAVEVIEKQAYSMGKEFKIILSSPSDTTVKAGIAGTVSNLQQDEDKKWIVVVYYKNYYLWYSGISKPTVKEDQKVKAGDTLGFIETGGKLELHVFDFETPVDPKKYLDCKM